MPPKDVAKLPPIELSCEPFIASVEDAEISPSDKPVIFRDKPSLSVISITVPSTAFPIVIEELSSACFTRRLSVISLFTWSTLLSKPVKALLTPSKALATVL